MLIITNRRPLIEEQKLGNGLSFGEKLPLRNNHELAFAEVHTRAEGDLGEKWRDPKIWRVQRINEAYFKDKLEATCRNFEHIVVFVHGFDQLFRKALCRAMMIERLYQVPVVLFSWPSCPRILGTNSKTDKVLRYVTNRARRKAGRSARGLIAALNVLHDSIKANHPETNVTLFVHSMGNLVLKRAAESDYHTNFPPLADLLVIHQADVPQAKHGDWLKKVPFRQLLITRNNRDKALCQTHVFKSIRLGACNLPLEIEEAVSANLTDTPEVTDAHMIPLDRQHVDVVNRFYQTIFQAEMPTPDAFPEINFETDSKSS